MIMSPPNCNEIMSPLLGRKGLELGPRKEVPHERRCDIYDARSDTLQSHSIPLGEEDGHQGCGFGSEIVLAAGQEAQEEGEGDGRIRSGSREQGAVACSCIFA